MIVEGRIDKKKNNNKDYHEIMRITIKMIMIITKRMDHQDRHHHLHHQDVDLDHDHLLLHLGRHILQGRDLDEYIIVGLFVCVYFCGFFVDEVLVFRI